MIKYYKEHYIWWTHTIKWIIASLEQHWHKCRIKTKELKLYLEFVLDVMLSYDGLFGVQS